MLSPPPSPCCSHALQPPYDLIIASSSLHGIYHILFIIICVPPYHDLLPSVISQKYRLRRSSYGGRSVGNSRPFSACRGLTLTRTPCPSAHVFPLLLQQLNHHHRYLEIAKGRRRISSCARLRETPFDPHPFSPWRSITLPVSLFSSGLSLLSPTH